MIPEECSTSAGKEKKLLSRTSRSIGVTDSSVKSYTHSETGTHLDQRSGDKSAVEMASLR